MRDPDVQSLRIIGLLLSHPDEELFAARRELVAMLCTDPRASALTRAGLQGWAESSGGLLDAQEEYSATFDGGRRTSLHLFEHVHGDGKQRGSALSELTTRYAGLGFASSSRELPDYLPQMCELAGVAGEPGLALLVEARPVVELLQRNLEDRQSPFDCVVRALGEILAGGSNASVEAPATGTRERASGETPELLDLDALDREWAEAPVEFGASAAHDALIPLRRSRDATSPTRSTP